MTKKGIVNVYEMDNLKKEVKTLRRSIEDLTKIIKDLVGNNTNIDIKKTNIINNNVDNENKTAKTKQKKVKRECIEKVQYDFLIKEIKEHITDDNKKFNLLLVISILFYTGLRISEVIALNKTQILELFTKEELNVYCSKSNENRTIYLFKETQTKMLNDIFNIKNDEFFNKIDEKGFISSYNNKLTERTISHWMRPFFDKLGEKFGDKRNNDNKIKGSQWSFHSFRTNLINHFIRNGININDVSKLIGHSDIKTTFEYYRNKKPTKIEVYEIYKKSNLLL